MSGTHDISCPGTNQYPPGSIHPDPMQWQTGVKIFFRFIALRNLALRYDPSHLVSNPNSWQQCDEQHLWITRGRRILKDHDSQSLQYFSQDFTLNVTLSYKGDRETSEYHAGDHVSCSISPINVVKHLQLPYAVITTYRTSKKDIKRHSPRCFNNFAVWG